MEKEGFEIIIIFILALIIASVIILFLANIGLRSNLLGSLPWIESAIIVFMIILGLK